ncbi:MAG: DUF4838 domain-containing protein [Candidatus Latescibacterota bacterium]
MRWKRLQGWLARAVVAAGAAGVAGDAASAAARAAAGADPADGAWYNALAPTGEGVRVRLAAGGQAACDILVPPGPTAQERKAAEELARWLQEMSGAPFAVVEEGVPDLLRTCTTTHPGAACPADSAARAHLQKGGSQGKAGGKQGGSHAELCPHGGPGSGHAGGSAGRPVISLGRTRRLVTAGLGGLQEGLGPEGYAIGARDGDLFLVGGAGRGPLTAVFALLEEDLGCRWYTAQAHGIPRREDLTGVVVPRSYSPPFAVRDPFSFVSNDADWALRNRANPYGAGIPPEWGGNLDYAPGWFVHTYERILPGTEEMLAAWPECFMLDEDGSRSARQLCPTHPRVVERAIAAVSRVLEEHPDADLVDVSQNDIRGYCHCDRCLALIAREGSPAAPLLYLVNRVALAVAQAHPGVTITFLGYQDTVPAPRSMRTAPNVAVRLATDITWNQPFVPASQSKPFMEALAGWECVADRIHIWDYQVNFGDYFLPWPSLHAKAENLRLFAGHRVTGVMVQGSYQGPGSERQLMRAWVLAKLLWDPSRDLWPLVQDFVRGYYGPAAGPLEAYNRMLHDCGRAGQGVVDCLGAETFVERAGTLFDQAEVLAWTAGGAHTAELLERVELARLPVLDVALPLARGRWVTSTDSLDLERYRATLARFATAARLAGGVQYSEGTRLADWVEQRRAFLSPPATAGERTVDLDGRPVTVYALPATWRLQQDADGLGETHGWFAVNLDDGEWAGYRTDLMAGWEEQGYPDTDGLFWFRQRVALPASCARSHVYLYFRACDEEAWVWVDGQPLGERTVASTGIGPYRLWLAPFALEATGRLRPGMEHTLAVRVSDTGGMGGLYLAVFVVAADMPLSVEQITGLVAVRNPYER